MSNIVFPVILREQAGRRRFVILSGSDLPSDRGAMLSFGSKLRGNVRWHPGSSETTVNIMGPESAPLEFAGVFEDRKKAIVGHAQFQQFLIEDICKAGHLVLLEYGPIVRICRWDEAVFTVLALERIAYRIRLEPVDAGRSSSSRILSGLRRIPGVGAALGVVDELRGVLSALPPNLAPDRVTSAINQVGRAEVALDAAGAVLDVLNKGGTTAEPNQAKSTLTLLDDARNAAAATLTHVRDIDWQSLPGDALNALFTNGLQAAKTVGQAIRLGQEVGLVRDGVAKLAGEATRNVIYLVAAGETLQRIAQRVYGAASRWPEILRANALASQKLEPGQRLVIPNPPEHAKAISP